MYSDKESVNILTSLLVSFGIRHAVVCPGSRNAPIVHNLNECQTIECYPVTDERSAGFYALGMTQALNEPVAVCVTSGTALLNLLPAVAEACYQHLPVVVISADRPQQWIGQLDGQTLPQTGALGGFVRKAVSLPEHDHWYCNRLVNEALLETEGEGRGPVHINVPLDEPLFNFTVAELPCERTVVCCRPSADYDCLHVSLADDFFSAKRPMIVFGQTNPHDFADEGELYLYSHVIMLHESLSSFRSVCHADEVLAVLERGMKSCNPQERAESEKMMGELRPDFVLYLGDCVVSKRLRHFLRHASEAKVWHVSQTGQVEDTFCNLRGIFVGDAECLLASLSGKLKYRQCRDAMDYRRKWLRLLKAVAEQSKAHHPAYSQMAAVKCFEEKLSAVMALRPDTSFHIHYANSTVIRLANIYARHHVWCNRGVNGIDGSLSTAAGFSVATDDKVVCVTGDLSFFYDQNALWNSNLRGNLRILLLNNGGGGIFRLLPGLEQSAACGPYVSAEHQTTAEGICMQNNIGYLHADNQHDMEKRIGWLLSQESARPLLLEVSTRADEDVSAMRDYYLAVTRSAWNEPDECETQENSAR